MSSIGTLPPPKGSFTQNQRITQDVDPKLREAAEGLEAMFIDYMMKVMRQTVPKNEMDFESAATEIYRGMLDSEYARISAETGGVGLTDLIIDSLQKSQYTQKRDPNGSRAEAVPQKTRRLP